MAIVEPLDLEITKPSPDIVSPKNPFSDLGNTSLGSGYLLPTVAPSQAIDSKISAQDLLTMNLSKNTTSQYGPAYEYTTDQEERYSNPFLQFTPDIQGFKTTEGAYGSFQGAGEQFINSIVKLGATAGSTFLSQFTGIPNQIDALRKGDVAGALFDQNSVFAETQEWLNSLENKFPNYKTDIESERPWYINAFTPTGAMNFWGDTVLKNAGFTIGSLVGALVVDAGLELLSGGTATPATMILAGKQISKALGPLKNMFRSLTKASTLNKVDEVAGLVNMTGSTAKALNATNKVFDLGKASKFVATSYMGAQGEAMIEGYHTYVDTKTKLIEEALNNGVNINSDYLKGIEETASHAGKNTMLFNMAVLSVSNLTMFPKIFGLYGGSNLLKQVDSPFLKLVQDGGLKVTNTYTRKQAIKNVLKDTFFKGFLPEGLEEGSQYYIGHSLHDYYIDKFNNKSRDGMLEYMGKAIPKTLSDGQFWEEALIGGLSGALMGGILPGGEIKSSVRANLIGAKARNDKYVSMINENLDLFNHAVADLTQLGEIVSQKKQTENFQSSYKALHSTVLNMMKFNTIDNFKDALSDLSKLPLEEFNKLFFTNNEQGKTTGFKSEIKKQAFIERLFSEVENIENDANDIAQTFTSNPFSNSEVRDILKKKFKLKDEQLSGAENKLFEDWKQIQTYSIGRLRNTQARVKSLDDDLKLATGMDSEEYDVLRAVLLSSTKGKSLSSYIAFKNRQLETLQFEREYYETLGNKVKLSAVNKVIAKKQKLYSKLETLLNQEQTPAVIAEIEKLVLLEETPLSVLREVLEKTEQLKKEQEIVTVAEQEVVRNSESPEESAKEMIEVVEQMTNMTEATNEVDEEATSTPSTNVPTKRQIPEMGFPLHQNLRNVNVGTKLQVDGLEPFTVTDNSKTEVDSDLYTFRPDYIVKKSDNVVIEYDSVGKKFSKVQENTAPAEVTESKPETPTIPTIIIDTFKQLTDGKQIVQEPNAIGREYVKVNGLREDGFFIYKLLSIADGVRTYLVSFFGEQGLIRSEREVKLKPQDLYSIDGELEINTKNTVDTKVEEVKEQVEKEKPVEIVPEKVNTKQEEVIEDSVVKENVAVEEKIKSFIGTNSTIGLDTVLLSAVKNNILKIDC